MSKKERDRTHYFKLLSIGEITVDDVARHVRLSSRQVYRLKLAYERDGDAGLVHQLRGRPSNNGFPRRIREEVLQLYRQYYSDYGPTLFSEKLVEIKDVTIDPETLRRWLIADGQWELARHRGRHRKKRPRREAIGSLVQIDGSHHDWFEGRGPRCCLFVFIDDASNQTYFRFAPSENAHDALVALRGYVQRYGRFHQAYTDKKSIFINVDGSPTDFANAVTALGGEMVYANSPQAKGRVERANRTHQDRLVKALRELGISTIEAANQFLDNGYMDRHNERFAYPAELPDIHRPLDGLDLDNIICFSKKRCVKHDMTFQYLATFYQIHRTDIVLPLPNQYVTIRIWLDGTLHAFWRNHELRITACTERPKVKKNTVVIPPDSHPWNHARPIGKAKRKTIKELCHAHK